MRRTLGRGIDWGKRHAQHVGSVGQVATRPPQQPINLDGYEHPVDVVDTQPPIPEWAGCHRAEILHGAPRDLRGFFLGHCAPHGGQALDHGDARPSRTAVLAGVVRDGDAGISRDPLELASEPEGGRKPNRPLHTVTQPDRGHGREDHPSPRCWHADGRHQVTCEYLLDLV